MSKIIKPVLIFVAAIFLAWVIMSGRVAAENGTSFHCSLELYGKVTGEVDLRLSEDGTALQYELIVHNVEDITMAHLHLGEGVEIGSPVVWLYPSGPPPKLISGPFEGVLARGTITRDDLIGALRGQPLSSLIEHIHGGDVHVNIHTLKHASGDICGPVYLTEESK